MKNSKILVMMLTVLVFAACQKEDRDTSLDGRLVFKIEGDNDTKTTVTHANNTSTVAWVTGDSVRINDKVVRVVSDHGTASAANPFDGMVSDFYAVYPSSLCNEAVGSSVTLNLPAEYTYAVSDGKQNLKTPMVAYAPATASELVFKHVTAAIGVEVKNYHDYAITVDQITVTSNSYKINGSVTISLGNEITVSPQTTETASEKTVTMNFNGGTTLTVPAGQTAIVQVPVLPVGDGNKFTVSVQVSKTSPAVTATLTRTQTTGGSLARAKMGYARYTLGGPFSVSSTKKVVFSKGNLQYNANTNTFSFAANQYDYIGSTLGNTADTNTRKTQSDLIDLFGWATSGYNGLKAYYRYPMLNAANNRFGDGTANNLNANYDWGRYNAIGTDSAGTWRTMLKAEFDYLIGDSRTQNTSNMPAGTNSGAAKYTKAKIGTTCGVILFPDNYIHPEGISVTGTPSYNTPSKDYSTFVVSTDDWEIMALSGAIFLPAAGYGKTYESSPAVSLGLYYVNTAGNYWTATASSTVNAQYYSFTSSTFAASPVGKSNAKSVRLVRDVE